MIRSIFPKSLLLLAICFGNYQLTAANGLPVTRTDKEQIVDVIKTLFTALTNDDLNQFHTVVTNDFYSFDGGTQLTGDALLDLVKHLHAEGNIYAWQVTEPNVHVYGDIAFVTYVNRGSLQNASGTKNMHWLESILLKKENGRWRIHFFHSTRMK